MPTKRSLVILGFAAFLFLNPFIYLTKALAETQVSEDAKVFLNNLENAVRKMDTYRFTIVSENWKGKLYEKKELRFSFKKPNLMRTDVLEGNNKGNSVVLNKERKIRGKNTWGLRKTLDPSDRKLKNIRGNTFMDSSLINKTERIKDHILERGCQAAIKETEFEGTSAYHLHIDHDDSDDTVTSEDLWFNKDNFMLLKNVKYEGNTKVSDATWLEFEINIPLEDELFAI